MTGAQTLRQYSFVAAVTFVVCFAGNTYLLTAAGLDPLQQEGALRDPGDDALRRAGFPWYDIDTGAARDWPVPEMIPAVSADRERIPEQAATPQSTFNRVATPGGFMGLSLLTWAIIGAFVLALVALLIWGYTRIDAGRKTSSRDGTWDDLQDRIHELPFEVDAALSGDFRSMAWNAYEREEYAQAIMLLFSHVLLMLDRRGFVRLQKGKTNHEYLREVRIHGELAEFYQQVMVPFERSFYGHHPLDGETFLRCWKRLDAFESGVAESDAAMAVVEEKAR